MKSKNFFKIVLFIEWIFKYDIQYEINSNHSNEWKIQYEIKEWNSIIWIHRIHQRMIKPWIIIISIYIHKCHYDIL